MWNVLLPPFRAVCKGPGDAPSAWKGILVPHLFVSLTPTCFLTFIFLLYDMLSSALQVAYTILHKSTKTFASSFFPYKNECHCQGYLMN